MKIGTVKEIKVQEYRVGLTPNCVSSYVKHGHQVYVETAAGSGSGFSDDEYAAAGATICADPQTVFESCDMIVKVKEPLEAEYQYFRKDLILFTYLHLAACKDLAAALLQSGIKAVAFETIEDEKGSLPCLRPMSEIAGRLSIQEGAKYLEKPFGGRGVLLSGVPGVEKCKVTIIGGGIAGANACRIAAGMGADVTILDLNIDRLAYLDDVFNSKITTLYSSEANIFKSIMDSDLVIGAVLIPGASAPKLIKREYLKHMKKGSVIVDIAVDQGGCCETTRVTYHDDPIFEVDGVIHYCVGNMPGAVPRTSTLALANTTLPFGLMIADLGLEQACKENSGLASGVNVYNGFCTYEKVAESLGLEYKPLDGCISE
ncbi:MAG: alanine dehydrogenase [Saccharofermentanales bacterium]